MGPMKKIISDLIPSNSTIRWIIRLAINSPLFFSTAIFRSLRANFQLTGGFFLYMFVLVLVKNFPYFVTRQLKLT